ncbi:MAG: porin [Thermodesulfovibrionales bacterium]|nr:porin [Thermodesulfovibrionales bacterium]
MKKGGVGFFVLISFLLVMTIPAIGGEPQKDSSTTILAQATTRDELQQEIDALKKKLEEIRTLEERIKTLEKRLEETEKVTTKIEKEEAALKEEKKQRAISYWKDGWNIETPDKRFRLNMAGVLHFDTRVFESGRSTGGFDIRRARYDMRGYLYRGDIEHVFRLQIEMADSPYLRNAYWMFKFRPELNIQIGQFKIPSGGADWLTEEAQVNFVEYATGTPVSPFFDRGVNIHSHFLGGKVQTCLGVFTGAGIDADTYKGDQDTHRDYVGRLLLVPFKDSEDPYLKGLHFAGSYQHGYQSIKTKRGETSNRTENYESRWFRWVQDYVDVDERTRYGGEFHWLFGPATFSYEFNRVEWEDITVYKKVDKDLVFQGRYPDRYHADVHQVWVSYFLTGEEKRLADVFFAWRQPKPKKNFSLKEGTWGAWELLARYAFHDSSSDLFSGTNAPLQGSSEGYSVTGGIRWIWNPKVRIMLDANYCKSTEGDGLVIERSEKGGTARHFKETETAVLMRLILTP